MQKLNLQWNTPNTKRNKKKQGTRCYRGKQKIVTSIRKFTTSFEYGELGDAVLFKGVNRENMERYKNIDKTKLKQSNKTKRQQNSD